MSSHTTITAKTRDAINQLPKGTRQIKAAQRCFICDKRLGSTYQPAHNGLPAMCLVHGMRVVGLMHIATATVRAEAVSIIERFDAHDGNRNFLEGHDGDGWHLAQEAVDFLRRMVAK